jgi:hypothetical protein
MVTAFLFDLHTFYKKISLLIDKSNLARAGNSANVVKRGVQARKTKRLIV